MNTNKFEDNTQELLLSKNAKIDLHYDQSANASFTENKPATTVFISYSHDSEHHKNVVRKIAVS